MNKLAVVVYVFFFASVGVFENYYSKEGVNKRVPSNTVTGGNCTSGIRYLFKRNTRGRQFRNLIKQGNIEGIKELFWSSHRAERVIEKIHSSRFTKWLRRRNQSTFVPALFQTKNNFVKSLNGEDVDTMSTIWKVVDDSAEQTEDETKAIASVEAWIGHVKRYQNRIDGYLERSVEYHQQIDGLRTLRWEPWMSDIDGEGVEIPMVMYSRNEDGTTDVDIRKSRFFPTSQTDIDYKIENLEHETSTIFAGNFAREARKKSKLYEAMLDQALHWRRLELVNERFGRVAIDKLSDKQKSLMREIRQLLIGATNDEGINIAPRRDAMTWVKKKEARVEFWQAMRLWKSNRVAADMEFEMPKFMLDRASSISPVALITPLFFVAAGTAKTLVSNIYEDNPHYQYYTGMISDGVNNFLFNTLGLSTKAMRACFEAERTWTRNEVAQSQIINAHLSRYVALDRIEPEANHLESQEYIRLRNDLFAECRERAQEHRSLETHADGKEAILSAQVSRLMAHKILEEIIIEHHDGGRRLARKVYDFFEAREYQDDTMANELEAEISAEVGRDFFNQLVEYENNLLLIEERLNDPDFESSAYFNSIQDYFDYINGFVEAVNE